MSTKVDSALSSVGVDRGEFEKEAQTVEETDSDVIDLKKDLSKDGLTEDEQDQIGEEVARKALEKMGVNFDSLSDSDQMALADFCGNCLDEMANEAVDATENGT